jgi:aminoglycoside phosphotransferase (APT) family kinase protein
MPNDDELEGISRHKIEDWIAAHTDEIEPPFEWTRLTGGTSNLTYAISDAAGRRAVVRRPPTGKLLPKAHDMEREHKILYALAPTPVAIARPFALCTDPTITGAPFYVMEFCEGISIAISGGEMLDLPMEVRPRVGTSMVGALVELHKIDPIAVGLERLGRPDGYVSRQLNRWYDSWQRSHEAAQIDLPSVALAFDALSRQVPEQGPARICHGDYGPHNVLISESGDVVAITDWEIGTLGDPLADIAYFVRGWADEEMTSADEFLDARRDVGYLSRRELIAEYEKSSGCAINNLWYYMAFNSFKSLCISQGVYGRFMGGVRGAQGISLDDMRSRILRLADATTRAIEYL